jgi:hypothetical protein
MAARNKLAVRLPAHAMRGRRRAVRQTAPSVRTPIAAESEIEAPTKLEDLASLLDEMLAGSGGPLSAAERRAADCALGIPIKKPVRRRT